MSLPAAYLGVILIWSTTPLCIIWSTAGSNPSFAVFSRMLIGAVLCASLLLALRVKFPLHRKAVMTYLVSGSSMFSSMSLTYWSAQSVNSGMISVLFGLLPLMASLGAMIWLSERSLSTAKLSGMLLGLLGLLMVFYGSLQFDHNMLLGLLVLLLAVLLQAAGLVGMKYIGDQSPPLATTFGALVVALPGFALVWLCSGAEMPAELSTKTWGAILYLGVFGSVFGFALYYYLIKHMDAGRIALITLITPVFALLIGHWLNQEVVLLQIWFGAGLIMLGLCLHYWGEVWLALMQQRIASVFKRG